MQSSVLVASLCPHRLMRSHSLRRTRPRSRTPGLPRQHRQRRPADEFAISPTRGVAGVWLFWPPPCLKFSRYMRQEKCWGHPHEIILERLPIATYDPNYDHLSTNDLVIRWHLSNFSSPLLQEEPRFCPLKWRWGLYMGDYGSMPPFPVFSSSRID
ncbi:hypothetical protein F5Y13DRAFT_89473 [Hypoxylon sp. FL1857]|nr:hypothetical protein F5Y13DRAFT_89473 [Hypoxylon sp. FL1857]